MSERKAETIDDLQLGNTIYEIDPWENAVYRRYVATEQVVRRWDDILQRLQSGKRLLSASGGFLSSRDITESSWGTTFFADRKRAGQVLAERRLALQNERKAQLQKEADRIQKELGEIE